MNPRDARPDQIYMRDENDEWRWVSTRKRAVLDGVAVLLGATALCIVGALVFATLARADANLPGGITCAQVVHYAGEFNIPNTTMGRLRAKVIAAVLGMQLTNAQLDAAAKCLRQSKLYVCTPRQAEAGECLPLTEKSK